MSFPNLLSGANTLLRCIKYRIFGKIIIRKVENSRIAQNVEFSLIYRFCLISNEFRITTLNIGLK